MNSRQWRCENGHILGTIEFNGNKIPYLALFRHAIDENADIPEAVDVIGPVMGQMPVTCDVDGCGDVRVWKIKPAVLAEFLKTANRGERDEIEARLLQGKVKKTTRLMNKAKVMKP